MTIACPKWSISALEALLEDFQVENDRIRIMTPRRLPVLWNIYQKFFLKLPKEKKSFKYYLYSGMAGLLERTVSYLVEVCSWIIFVAMVLLVGICGILLLPLALVGFILIAIAYLFKTLLRKGKGATKGSFKRINRFYTAFSSKRESVNETLYRKLLQFVGEQLVKMINSDGSVDVWFCPTLFWEESLKLKGTVVLTAPDLVSQEFPLGFANYPGSAHATEECVSVLKQGAYFTVYSDVIKNEVLVNRYRKDPSAVVVIPNIMNKCDPYLEFAAPAYQLLAGQKESMQDFARSLLQQLPRYSAIPEYVNNFNFKDVKYIFYASQLRYSKNIYNLLQAYMYLLRHRNIQIKLFLTCTLDIIPEVRDFILKNRLQYDVLAFTRVPVQHLAALYCCSELVVNPTLYEGGFLSFTFGEGMSVGTPSIMSRIPQVTDVTNDFHLDDVLFDPYNYLDIADKIEYWLYRKDELYEKELPLYQELDKRSPVILAEEYVQAFQHFIDLDKQNRSLNREETHNK